MKSITGLWAPLVTPMFHGDFDAQAMRQLINYLEPYVDGYVPCLSSGEGDVLSDELWKKVVACVVKYTKKRVVAGIKRSQVSQILNLAESAQMIGADAIIIPSPPGNDQSRVSFYNLIAQKTKLPLVLYNTEKSALTTIEAIKKMDSNKKIIGIKDSSGHMPLFNKIVKMRKDKKLRINILQGMEHLLFDSRKSDGYLTSLLVIEPELCQKMWNHPTKELHEEIMEKFWEYNLGGEWYVTLKALLYNRGIIRSAEQVQQTVKIPL